MSPPPAVIGIVSADDLLRREAIAAWRQRVVGPAADFNAETFDPTDEGVQALAAAAGTLPVMAPRRWVHIDRVNLAPARALQRLAALVARPPPEAVICLGLSRQDGRSSLGRALAAHPHVRLEALAVPRPYAMPAWLAQRARAAGLRLSLEGARALVDRHGPEPGPLAQALAALACHAHPETSLGPREVALACGLGPEPKIFALIDHIVARAWAPAARLLAELMGQGQSAPGIFHLLVRQLRQLGQVHARPAGRRHAAALAADLGLPGFIAQRLAEQARGVQPAWVLAALRATLNADLGLKSGRGWPAGRLEALVAELTLGGGAGPAPFPGGHSLG